jgi:ComF family protein
VLLAPACAACGATLDAPSAGPVCAPCWSRIVPFTAPCCERCGDPLGSWRREPLDGARCAACRDLQSPIARIRAIGAYDGAHRDVVHALKYDGRHSIASRLGALMRRHGADVLAGADAAVPVPLHRTRRFRRGFNQAEAVASALELPVARALRRVRRTAPQADLPASRRFANVHAAFAMRRGIDVRGRVLVLIDDVMTTGATLEACAAVLAAAGAREVRALTAAKAVRRRP